MKKPHVDKWDLPKEAEIMKVDGSNIIFDFNKVFKRDIPDTTSAFIIRKKDSYISCYKDKYDDESGELVNKGAAHYVNYLMHFYDKEREIPVAYITMKYFIDKKTLELSDKKFRKKLYSTIFTPAIKDMIWQMVEDNWCIEIENAGFSEPLLFEERHVKTLMAISIGMKLIVPIIMHYIYATGSGKDKIFYFLKPALKTFSGDTDMYIKLYYTVLSRVEKSIFHNRTTWNQQEILDVEEYSKVEEFLKVNIISEAMVRYVFEKNPIFFNSVFINKQLRYFAKTPYSENLSVVDNAKNSDGLSGMDKLEMASVKIDESIPILSSLNIENTINKLLKKMKVGDIKAEVEYYKAHTKIDKLQTQLLNYFYANMFGGYRDLGMLNRTQYFTLLVVMKKRLLYSGYVYIPQIITANVSNFSKRIIQNKKFISKIETSPFYQNLIQTKFPEIVDSGRDKHIIGLLSSLINSKYSIVDYDAQDKYGEELIIQNVDTLSDEFLNFLTAYL